MKMTAVEIRMRPDKIEALRALARRLAYERGKKCTWADLAREGAEIILQTYGGPAPQRGHNPGLTTAIGGAQ
jgi:hypothetical protein